MKNQQREKVYGVNSNGDQVHDAKSPFPGESHRMHLIFPAGLVTIHEKYLPLKFIRDSVPRDFTGDWSQKHFLLSTYQKSRLPEESRFSA